MLIILIGHFESSSSPAKLPQQKESNPKVHNDNDNTERDSFACQIPQWLEHWLFCMI